MSELEKAVYKIIEKLWFDDFNINQIESVIRPNFHYLIEEVLADNLPF